jgi:hypothetical protein
MEAAPTWRWLTEPWPYAIPESSIAAVNVPALFGERITEAARWEDHLWEMSVGRQDEVDLSEVRKVPIGVLIAIDPTLAATTELKVMDDGGHALIRDDSDGDWQAWGRKQSDS